MANAEAAMDFAVKTLGWPKDGIKLFGRSLGTGPTVQLAAQNQAGLFLGRAQELSGCESPKNTTPRIPENVLNPCHPRFETLTGGWGDFDQPFHLDQGSLPSAGGRVAGKPFGPGE